MSSARLTKVLWPLVALACDSPKPAARFHPDPDYRARAAIEYEDSSDLTTSPSIDSAVRSSIDSSFAIGVDTGEVERTFGRVVDAKIDRHRRVLVADDRLGEVRVYDPKGRLLQTLGGQSARGPALRSWKPARTPVALATDWAGHLYLGQIDHRVLVFESDASGYRPLRSIPVGVLPKSMCVMGDSLFVAGSAFGDSLAVRVYDVSGRLLSSFAPTYRSSNRMINNILTTGRVACDEQNRLLLFAPASPLFELRAYHPDGTPVWAFDIGGAIPARIEDIPPDGYAVQTPRTGFHRLQSLILLGRDTALLQIAFANGVDPNQREPLDVTSFVVHTPSGRVLHKTKGYPPTTAVRGRILITPYDEPFARVVVRRVHEW